MLSLPHQLQVQWIKQKNAKFLVLNMIEYILKAWLFNEQNLKKTKKHLNRPLVTDGMIMKKFTLEIFTQIVFLVGIDKCDVAELTMIKDTLKYK